MFIGWQEISGLVQTPKYNSLPPEGSGFPCMRYIENLRLRNKYCSVSREERKGL